MVVVSGSSSPCVHVIYTQLRTKVVDSLSTKKNIALFLLHQSSMAKEVSFLRAEFFHFSNTSMYQGTVSSRAK